MNQARLKDLFIFLIGLLGYVQVRVIGTFAVSEVIILLFTIFIPIKKFWHNPYYRKYFLFAFVWLAGVLLADFWNNTPTEDAIKGSFNVLLLIAICPFCYWALADKPARYMYYLLGFAFSRLYNYYFQYHDYTDYDYQVWLVYAYYPMAMVVGGLLYYYNKKNLSYVVVLAFSVWSLFHYSRNIFLVQSMAIITLMFINYISRNNKDFGRVFSRRVAFYIVLLIIGLYAVSNIYSTLAGNGTLGIQAQQKYIRQNRTKIGVASGRGDFVTAAYLASRNPIIGYGSYAKDKDKVSFKFGRQFDAYKEASHWKKTDLLAGHSYILGAWVYAGVLGFLFFAFILYLMWLFLRKGAIVKQPLLTGLLIYIYFKFLWDILFSPFADRLSLCMFVSVLAVLMYNTDQEKQQYLQQPD